MEDAPDGADASENSWLKDRIDKILPARPGPSDRDENKELREQMSRMAAQMARDSKEQARMMQEIARLRQEVARLLALSAGSPAAGPHPIRAEYTDDGISYTVVRNDRRKNLGLVVRPDGSVEVRVPADAPLSAIKAYVLETRDWIVKTRRKYGFDEKGMPVRDDAGTPHHDDLDGEELTDGGITYTIRRNPRRKHTMITVLPSGRVEARAGPDTPVLSLRSMILHHKEWILKKQREIAAAGARGDQPQDWK